MPRFIGQALISALWSFVLLQTSLFVHAQPDNDLFAHRAMLSGEEVLIESTLFHATSEPDEEILKGNSGEPSVWWTWVAPRDAYCWLSVSLSAGAVRVFEGDDLTNLRQVVGRSRSQPRNDPVSVQFQAREGVAYTILVHSSFEREFFQLSLTAGPGNDVTPARLDGESFVIHADLTHAQPDEGFSTDPTVSWEWTAPRDGRLSLRMKGPYVAHRLEMYREPNPLQNRVEHYYYGDLGTLYNVRAAQKYRIVLSAPNFKDFEFDLTFSDLQLSGVTENQEFLPDAPISVTLSNLPPGTARIVLTRHYVPVATNLPGSALTWLTDSAGPQILCAYAEDGRGQRFIGNPVRIGVASRNDAFARAEFLDADWRMKTFYIHASSVEVGEPQSHPASVWFRFRTDQAGTAHLTGNTRIAVYEGSSLGSLALITNVAPGAFGGFRVAFRAKQDTEYRVAALSTNSIIANLRLDVGEALLNDDFADRQPLLGSKLQVRATLRHATSERGDRLGAGFPSIWYTWDASADGEVRLSVVREGSAQFGRPMIQPFASGTNLQTLRPLSFARRSEPEPPENTEVIWFPVLRGSNYIWSIADGGGAITMDLEFAPGPPNDAFARAAALEGIEVNIEGSLRAAAGESVGPTSVRGGEGGHGVRAVWHQWAAPQDGDASVAVLQPSTGVQGRMFAGSSISNLTSIATFSSALRTVRVTRGTRYYIAFTQTDAFPGVPFVARISMGAPSNDFFANRRPLTGTSAALIGTTQGATSEPEEPVLGRTTWWSWTAPVAGWASLASHKDLGLAVFTGDSLTSLDAVPLSAPVAHFGGDVAEWVRRGFACQAGQIYQIAVHRTGALHFSAHLDVTSLHLQSPADGTSQNRGTIEFEFGSVDPAIDGEIGPVILQRLPSSPQKLLIESGKFSWTNEDSGHFTFFALATNSAGHRRISKPVSVHIQPLNDDFTNSLPIESQARVEHLAGATVELGEPASRVAGAVGSRWWHWTAPVSGDARLQSTLGSAAVDLDVFTGASVETLSPVTLDSVNHEHTFAIRRGVKYFFRFVGSSGGYFFAPDSPIGERLQWSPITFVGLAETELRPHDQLGFEIFIDLPEREIQQVHLTSGSPLQLSETPPFNRFVLPRPPSNLRAYGLKAEALSGTNRFTTMRGHDVAWPPTNDDFRSATALFGSRVRIHAALATATREEGEPVHNNPAFSRTVWWRWTAPANGVVKLGLSDFRFEVFLYVGNTAANLERQAEIRPGSSTYQVQGGREYHIVLESGSEGKEMRLDFAPAATTNAVPLPGNGPFSVHFGHTGASPEIPARNFSWTAPGEGFLSISGFLNHPPSLFADGSSEMLPAAYFYGAQVESLFDSKITWEVAAGMTYLLSFPESSDEVRTALMSLDWFPRPRNDHFENAADMSSGSEAPAPWVGATVQQGEHHLPETNNLATVWFRWTAPKSGAHMVFTRGNGTPTVFSGTNLNTLVAAPSIPGDTIVTGTNRQFHAESGIVYHVRVHGSLTNVPAVDFLQIVPLPWPNPPQNDSLAGAVELSGRSWSVLASNAHASREFREPLHDGIYGGRSVWWKWTAPMTGRASISSSSESDHQLALYQGAQGVSVGDLQPIHAVSTGWSPLLLSFHATVGATYFLALDAARGSEVETRLALAYSEDSSAPTLSIFRNGVGLTLRATGRPNAVATLQISSDLEAWSDGGALTFDSLGFGTAEVADPFGTRFFRLRIQ